ncbi:hypothetical protein BGX38DRAFT_1235090 [Terfezia claveryi]|nr:hypothetical protein BGX38DRAFT_1235090 [Terfezia claveryi]
MTEFCAWVCILGIAGWTSTYSILNDNGDSVIWLGVGLEGKPLSAAITLFVCYNFLTISFTPAVWY